jgi:hypothetical protein
MIAVMAISVIFRLRYSVGMQDLKEFKLEFPSNFLIGACVAWLLVPVGLKLIAAFGFFNLTVPRYLLPTLIANAIGVGLFISVCCQIAEQQIDANDAKHGFLRYKRFAIPAVIALLVFFAIAENIGIQRRVVASGRVEGKNVFSEKLLIQDQGTVPFLTTDAHNFFAYAYHTSADLDRNVSLIVDDAAIDRWRHFAPQIVYVALNELPSMKGSYHLCVKKSTSGEKSPFAELETRLATTGHRVREVRTSDEQTLYYVGNGDQ